MTREEIVKRRLHGQGIAASAASDPAAVVSALGAVQAQDYAGSLWSVGVRTAGATEAAVEQAIAERRIVRTWALRGTLHLLAAADVAWMLALVSDRLIAAGAGRWRQLGLDDDVLARAWKILRRALRDGPRPRDELMETLEARGIATANLRGHHLLWRLALERRICFGLRAGRQHTLVLAEDWLPKQRRLARRAALAELARRYFTSHGPATLADFAAWSGLTITDARDAVGRVSTTLAREVAGGIDYLRSRDETLADAARAPVVLLPGFDEYVVGYRGRDAIIEPRHAPKLVPVNNGLFQPTLVIDGRVRGVWRRELERDRVNMTIVPFAPLRPAERKHSAAAADRYAAFLGRTLTLEFGRP
jgi:hypothetical protein